MSDAPAIPLLDLHPQNDPIRAELDDAIARVMDQQQFVLGPAVAAFEEAFAAYCGTRYAVGCGSGSDALLLSLMALEVGPGDQVLCPAFTFFATASAITRTGALPVFVDVDPGTYNLDPEQARKAAARCTRLRAILPVDLFGLMADLEPLLALGRELGVPVVEDAAQSVGAEDARGRRAGSAANLGCMSFYPTKNLGAFGEAGIVLCDDARLAERLRMLRIHGAEEPYLHSEIGMNSRLDAIQAAVLHVKLPHLEDWNRQRRAIAHRYGERFESADVPLTPPAARPAGHRHVYHQYVIRVPSSQRDPLRSHLTEHGIGTQIYYPLGLHQQDCYTALGYASGDFPEAEAAARETLALPMYPGLADSAIDRVAETILAFLAASS